jgi:quercetin dioxygenase-like cupin family protein
MDSGLPFARFAGFGPRNDQEGQPQLRGTLGACDNPASTSREDRCDQHWVRRVCAAHLKRRRASDPLIGARIAPDEMKWEQGAGNPRAKPVGDDQKPGMYMYRSRFPANYKVQPHFHPDERIVTVMSGTLYVGYGEKFDESAMKALPAGSFWTEPAGQPHFVWAKDGEVVIQAVGANGPRA